MSRNYARLARHPGLSRVDGIGPIQPSEPLGSRVTVFFSGLNENGIQNPYARASLNTETLRLPVHSASLLDFSVGSVWRDGKRVLPGGTRRPEPRFHIDTSQTRLVRLDEEVALRDQIASTVVPDSHFNLGDNRSHLASTLYAISPVLNDCGVQWLVVPASELFRFYNGASARFLSAAFQGRLHEYVDLSLRRIEEGCPVLYERQPLSRTEAIVVARAIVNPTAQESLHGPHKNFALIQANNKPASADAQRPLIIKTCFPFQGGTELLVEGKRMPLVNADGKAQWAIFAMQIHDCSHPPGFQGLTIERAGSVGGPDQHGNATPGARPPHHFPVIPDDDGNDEEGDAPADQRLRRLAALNYSTQFRRFRGIKINYVRSEHGQRAGRSGGLHIGIPVQAFTAGEGSSANEAQGNLGISDFRSQVFEVDRDLEHFLRMLEQLRLATKHRGWKIVTRQINDSVTHGTDKLASFPENIGRRFTWHRVMDSIGEARTRQVVWTEVVFSDEAHYFYLAEMEMRPGETARKCTLFFYRQDFSRFADDDFVKLLKLTAVHYRWPRADDEWKKTFHRKWAGELFAAIAAVPIKHPSIKKKKKGNAEEKSREENGGVNSGQGQEFAPKKDQPKETVDPKEWSEKLLVKLDELLSAAAGGMINR